MTVKTPKLVSIEQVCDGWVKKHLLTYELPDQHRKNADAAGEKCVFEGVGSFGE